MNYYLAIDIGASSGRHILGHIENGRLVLEEIHRFEDYLKEENGSLLWDTEKIVSEVKKGIAKCGKSGKIPKSIAVDTWGVDYVLLGKDKREIMPAVSYRDGRTAPVQDEVSKIISQEELYSRTGIQKQNFNTVYQLYCDKKTGKLENAGYFLMMPDYLVFKLTGEIRNEYTNATTTNLVNAKTGNWDFEILDRLGIRKDIFSPVSLPCNEAGALKGFEFESKVVLAPSHDTASAVAACPVGDNGVYISSGTWSLIGTENGKAVLTDEAREANFTNEGGINSRFTFLKNIMGMWLLQSIRRNLDKRYSYDEMMNMAQKSEDYFIIDPNSPLFVSPENMVEAIRKYIGVGEIPLETVINSVYHSLAKSYAQAISEIETISGKTVDRINIVGGGSRDRYLNELTAKYTGKKVLAGPVEATATGNIISQLMFADKSLTIEKARELVKNSFEITEIN